MKTKRDERPRDRNRKPQGCADCPTWVEAGKGFLYRHCGANLTRHIKRSRYTKFTYLVRCEACALKHDGADGRAAITMKCEAGKWSGITYTGYGANSHAPCGN